MVLQNVKVKHASFGLGTVISESGQYFTVQFDATKKTFVYPDIFEKFLTLEDGTVSDDIKADLKSSKMAKQKILETKHEENLRAMQKGIVIPGKENNPEIEEEESGYKNSELDEFI